MGFRFQRSIKLFPGLKINLSKSGIGWSAGVRGAHTGVDAKGRRYTSVGIPGTGLSWRETQHSGHRPARKSGAMRGFLLGLIVAGAVALLVFFARRL